MISIPDYLKKEFEVMFRATSEASSICKKYREKIGNDLGVMTKTDESPVTRKQSNIPLFNSKLFGSG